MTARLCEWKLNVEERHITLLHDRDGDDPQEYGVAWLARWWPSQAWVAVAGCNAGMHEAHANGVARVAAARAGLIDPERVAGSYRINRRLVTFYVGDEHVISRQFKTVAGEAGRRVTEAARLYPACPMAAAWLIARDEVLERGLAREAA
jgi:hypothetical protein